jgi:hypothetical protein
MGFSTTSSRNWDGSGSDVQYIINRTECVSRIWFWVDFPGVSGESIGERRGDERSECVDARWF